MAVSPCSLCAGVLNPQSYDTLYDRDLVCRQEFEFLHFEGCDYQVIKLATRHGLAGPEAGARGAHKLQRGYEPVPTYSAHWTRDRGLRAAVERFLAQERRDMSAEIEDLREALAYRQE